MSQTDYIKDLARYGLENDQDRLLGAINDLIEYSKNTKKLNFALQLQTLIKDRARLPQKLVKVGSPTYLKNIDEKETDELILEKLTSDYSFQNLVCEDEIKVKLSYFLKEHQSLELLSRYNLPVSNKVILHGPSGCGKTLASYVISGELKKVMIVINLGAIVSSKLGETSKNLAKIFRKAAFEDCIIFIDEFDSIGKLRDYNQDHGEMKRVVNTILQLFDFLPQTSMVIAATNQVEMIDEALLRRFDLNIKFDLPGKEQIKKLVELTLKNGWFQFDQIKTADVVMKEAIGLSYYSIQKTLITAIKQSLFNDNTNNNIDDNTIPLQKLIDTSIWEKLILDERKALIK